MIRTRERIQAVREIKRDIAHTICAAVQARTYREMAELTGLSLPDISDILTMRMKRPMSVDRLLMILIVLGKHPKFTMLNVRSRKAKS